MTENPCKHYSNLTIKQSTTTVYRFVYLRVKGGRDQAPVLRNKKV